MICYDFTKRYKTVKLDNKISEAVNRNNDPIIEGVA